MLTAKCENKALTGLGSGVGSGVGTGDGRRVGASGGGRDGDGDGQQKDGQKDREYTTEELERASPKAKRRFNAWQKKVHDQAAGTALTYSIEVQDWEGWCRAEEGQYLKGYLVPHGKKRHGYLVRRVVEPFCNRSIHLP